MTLTEFATAAIANATTIGARDGLRNKEHAADCVYAQRGLCWLCGEELDDVNLDRLLTGRALGLCDCASDCRHGYLRGNFGAAHRACHAPGTGSVREQLSDAELLALAQRFLPTESDLVAARVDRRAARGRAAQTDAQRRLAAAQRRAQGA